MFPSVRWAINPSRMCLGALLISVPLMPTRAYLAMPVSIAVHRVHCWLRLLFCLTSASCITPSRSLRASQELRSFLISANLTSTCPVTIVCIVFSVRVFTIKFCWAKKSNDHSLNYFGSLRDDFDQ